MTRWWIEQVARVADRVGLPLLILGLFAGTTLVALLWYFWPAWIPRRMPRWPQWLRWRRRRGKKDPVDLVEEEPSGIENPGDVPADQLPDLPAAAFLSRADLLSAEGRYAEAVRERLRAMVRDLVDRHVIDHQPGWTVTELAAGAGAAHPPVAAPVSEACEIFSELWYGQYPAQRHHDDRMRILVDATAQALQSAGAGQGGSR